MFIFKLLMDPMKDESHASIHLNIAFQKIWRHRRNALSFFMCEFGSLVEDGGVLVLSFYYFRFLNAVLISFYS